MKWYQVKSFFTFYRKASTLYNVQSDFLYQLLKNGLDIEKEYYIYGKLEDIRARLLKKDRIIQVRDHGAGSNKLKMAERKLSDIAATSLSDKTTCRILFLLVEYFKCKNVLELGTSLGLSSLYLSAPASDIHVTTIEGDKALSALAQSLHAQAGAGNIQIIHGSFQEALPTALDHIESVDLAFIDGHHASIPTLAYFKTILEKCHEQSIIVFDDIYWSEDMTKAWQKIVAHPEVTLALDLYKLGIVFLNKNLSRQYFRYIPYKYKPWKIGIFG